MKDALSQLFEDRSHEVCLLVGFKTGAPITDSAVMDYTRKLRDFLRVNFPDEFRGLYLGSTFDFDAVDGIYKGKLRRSSEFRHFLVIKFGSRAALESYYRHPLASNLRRDLYSQFAEAGRAISEMYDWISEDRTDMRLQFEGTSADQQKVRQESTMQMFSSMIEDKMSEYISWIDLVDSQGLDRVVDLKPYAFPRETDG